MEERPLFAHKDSAASEDVLIVRGRPPHAQLAKHRFKWGQRGSWVSGDSCFVSFSFFPVCVWHGDSSGTRTRTGKVCSDIFFAVAVEINRLRSPSPPMGVEDTSSPLMPHLQAPQLAYTLVMTNGKGHTLALCVPHAASYPVMDSPLCHHHLLLGLGQNQ